MLRGAALTSHRCSPPRPSAVPASGLAAHLAPLDAAGARSLARTVRRTLCSRLQPEPRHIARRCRGGSGHPPPHRHTSRTLRGTRRAQHSLHDRPRTAPPPQPQSSGGGTSALGTAPFHHSAPPSAPGCRRCTHAPRSPRAAPANYPPPRHACADSAPYLPVPLQQQPAPLFPAPRSALQTAEALHSNTPHRAAAAHQQRRLQPSLLAPATAHETRRADPCLLLSALSILGNRRILNSIPQCPPRLPDDGVFPVNDLF
jgi:hypothetical protein